MAFGTVLYIAFVLSFVAYSEGYINPPDYGFPVLLGVIIWNVLLLIVTILVIIDSVKKLRAVTTEPFAKSVFVVKLVAIPFFLATFALLALLALGGMMIFIFGGAVMLVALAFGAPLTYLAMLSTSVYGWASIIQLRRERRIDTTRAVLYSLLLCLFVTDTVVAILLFARTRQGEKAIAGADSASIAA
jgi:hypothetical protein